MSVTYNRMPRAKTKEEHNAEVKDTYAKTFSRAVEVLEFASKAKGGVFAKTSVSAVWYHNGSFERVMYDPDLAVDDQLPLCPTAESYSEGAELGSTLGLMSPQDVDDYWEILTINPSHFVVSG